MLVLVTSSFPIEANGSEAAGSFVADLARRLSAKLRLRVVAPGVEGQREHWCEAIEVVRYAAPERPLSTLKPWRPSDLLWILRVLRGGLAATREALADDAVGVLALWGLPCGEWARRAARARGVPYDVWLLGSDVWSLGRIPVLRQMLGRVVRDAAHAYADGYQLADDARRIARRSVEFLPSTRDIASPSRKVTERAPPYRVLFLGRWHPNKGIDLLLDALALLDEADWRRIAEFRINGGGPLEGVVHAKADALRSHGRPVMVGGYLDKDQAAAAIVNADYLVIPSRIESIPVIFSDSVKLGTPVIATPVGDLPRLLAEASCGVLATAASAPALRDALRAALASSPGSFASGVRYHAAQFDLASIASRIHATVHGDG